MKTTNSIYRAAALVTLIFFNLTALNTVIKALSVNSLLSKKYNTINLSEPWYQAFGEPEDNGVWFVYGQTGNGKTSFMWQMVKELSNHGRVAYNSLEEGHAQTVQHAVDRAGLSAEERKRVIIISEDIPELKKRLKRQKSPKFIFIDSFQYTNMSWSDYLDLKKSAIGKVLIIVSQVDGRQPSGRTATRVKFDASLKIWIEGFRATSQGRYIGPNGGTYTIWAEGAARHWGESISNNNKPKS